MIGLGLLRVDENWIAVDKPSGMLSVPGRGPDKADCAVSRAAAEFGWVREVHRLDQPTSGAMILARNPQAHRRLSELFAAGRVRKVYAAVCAARPSVPDVAAAASGRLVLFQRLDPNDRPRQVPDAERGKKAVTLWKVSGEEDGRIRLELRPLTGRTHQLRLACAVMGAPILGDALYAPPDAAAASERLLRHAASIRFLSPFNGDRVVIEVPVPF